MKRRVFTFLAISFMIVVNASAEIIELKDGREIAADILRETEDFIVVSKLGGGFIYSISRDRIKAIRSSAAEEVGGGAGETTLPAGPKDARGTGEADRRKELEEYRVEKYEQEVLAAKKARGRVKIKFLENRFGIVEAVLNGKVRARLLVDSGASHVVISEEIAKRLAIKDLAEKPRIHAVLADGSVTTSIALMLDSVQVGDSRVKNVQAAISKTPPGQGVDGLLGMTFLGNFNVKMDAKENSLILEKY